MSFPNKKCDLTSGYFELVFFGHFLDLDLNFQNLRLILQTSMGVAKKIAKNSSFFSTSFSKEFLDFGSLCSALSSPASTN